MKPIHIGLCALVASALVSAATLVMSADARNGEASPIYGVTVPTGYRQWELVAPALEDAPLNELRAVLGNPIAVRAYRDGGLPFPDGSILVKLAWHREPSPDFEPASVPRGGDNRAGHGQGFKKILLDWWLGFRPLHQRDRGRRSAASDMLRLPSALGERARLRFHEAGALSGSVLEKEPS